MEILSEKPEVFIIDNFIERELCEDLIEWIAPNLIPSTVLDPITSQRIQSDYRNSYQWQPRELAPVATEIAQKVYDAFGLDQGQFQTPQFLRYEKGQYYKPHYDHYITQSNKDTVGHQRVRTFVIYLSDVEAGGETYFPKLKFGVAPQVGRLLSFRYDYDSATNDQTLHEAKPIKQGIKYALTLWQIIKAPIASRPS
jgi:prolyl 4-hydroxylase